MKAAGRLLVLGAARGLASGLALAGVLLVARLLGPEDVGRWSLALAAQGYALHLAELGLRGVAMAEAARAPAALPALLRRYLALRLRLAGAVLTVVASGAFWLQPEAAPLVLAATLAILPTALQLDWLALVDDRPFLAALPLVARPLAFLLLLATWPGAAGLDAVAGCYLASWWLAAALSWPALRRPWPRPGRPAPAHRRLLRRGLPLMLVTLTSQALLSADLLVVGWSLGAAAAGDYWLASQVAVAGLLFANAAHQLLLARLPACGDPGRFLAVLAEEGRRLGSVALLLALGLGLVGAPLLPALFGEEHAGAAPALLWLLPWLLLQHGTALAQGALTAAGDERAVLRGNLALLLALAPGLAAAATIGTLPAFAALRTAAELARLATLVHALHRRLRPLALAASA